MNNDRTHTKYEDLWDDNSILSKAKRDIAGKGFRYNDGAYICNDREDGFTVLFHTDDTFSCYCFVSKDIEGNNKRVGTGYDLDYLDYMQIEHEDTYVDTMIDKTIECFKEKFD